VSTGIPFSEDAIDQIQSVRRRRLCFNPDSPAPAAMVKGGDISIVALASAGIQVSAYPPKPITAQAQVDRAADELLALCDASNASIVVGPDQNH
jgi:hypothetical protein